MGVDITEFVEIDPDSIHAVYKAANGTPFLMIKAEGEERPDDDEKPDGDDDEKAEKGFQFCGDIECEVCTGRAAKGKLTMGERKRIPKSDFAIPDKAPEHGSYPINDKAHARNALSRVSQHGTPEEKARVRRAVASKYPDIGKGKKSKKKNAKKATPQYSMPGQQATEGRAHGDNPSPESAMAQTNANERKQKRTKDVLHDKGKPSIPDAGSINAVGEGFGDTAPDKDIHLEEAQGQTHERVSGEESRASKADVDMRGDTIEHPGSEVGERGLEQTEALRRRDAGGSDTIRDQMTREKEQAQKGFKFKVKKTGKGKKKNKKKAPHEMTGALKSGPERVLSVAHATKEFDQMTGAELAEVFVSVLDTRDARKAAERKDKKAKKARKAAKAERKAAKNGATTTGTEEAAREAAKSVMTPEKLVEGLGARVEEAFKQALRPIMDDISHLANQPARFRPAINETADPRAIRRDQPAGAASDPYAVFKPYEEAFKAAARPEDLVSLPDGRKMTKEKLGNELTKAKLVVRERLAHGRPVSAAEVTSLVAAQ